MMKSLFLGSIYIYIISSNAGRVVATFFPLGSFGLTGWIQTIGCLNMDGSLGGRSLVEII